MTPKERAAMQQALEALEIELEAETCEEFSDAAEKCYEAITALREALAEQANVSDGLCGGCAKKAADGWALYCVECWEKAEQEPVAYGFRSRDGVIIDCEILPDDYYTIPLYAAPFNCKGKCCE